ncbi:MAG: hypothetical protein KGI50_06770 [Patescibacteria group bacterium]|nr:hypothetical protein [Patescibacteria group bacterium]
MYLPEYVFVVYEIKGDKEYIFGIFSSEAKQIIATAEFESNDEFRVEKIKLDPA